MSWSVSTGTQPVEKMAEAIQKLELPVLSEGNPPYSIETVRQFYAAKEAALAVFKAGVVGDEGDYSVSVSGHSTDGFHNLGGHTPNSVTIYVQQVYHRD